MDAAHRLTSRAQSGTGVTPLSVKFIYNNRNERTKLERYSDATLTNLIGSTDNGFDDGGRLTSQVHKNGAGTTLVTYTNTFDSDNKLASETRNGVTKNFSYDKTDQVTNDSTNAYAYDKNGNRNMPGYQTGAADRTTTDGTWTYTHCGSRNQKEDENGVLLKDDGFGKPTSHLQGETPCLPFHPIMPSSASTRTRFPACSLASTA